jgi:hypothetical protein
VVISSREPEVSRLCQQVIQLAPQNQGSASSSL